MINAEIIKSNYSGDCKECVNYENVSACLRCRFYYMNKPKYKEDLYYIKKELNI
jgi:hypothetical protein